MWGNLASNDKQTKLSAREVLNNYDLNQLEQDKLLKSTSVGELNRQLPSADFCSLEQTRQATAKDLNSAFTAALKDDRLCYRNGILASAAVQTSLHEISSTASRIAQKALDSQKAFTKACVSMDSVTERDQDAQILMNTVLDILELSKTGLSALVNAKCIDETATSALDGSIEHLIQELQSNILKKTENNDNREILPSNTLEDGSREDSPNSANIDPMEFDPSLSPTKVSERLNKGIQSMEQTKSHSINTEPDKEKPENMLCVQDIEKDQPATKCNTDGHIQTIDIDFEQSKTRNEQEMKIGQNIEDETVISQNATISDISVTGLRQRHRSEHIEQRNFLNID